MYLMPSAFPEPLEDADDIGYFGTGIGTDNGAGDAVATFISEILCRIASLLHYRSKLMRLAR